MNYWGLLKRMIADEKKKELSKKRPLRHTIVFFNNRSWLFLKLAEEVIKVAQLVC